MHTEICSAVLQTAILPVDLQPSALLGRPIPVLDECDCPDEWLAAYGASVRCLMTHAMRGAAASLLERLPNLGLIANFGAGTDLIDLDYARCHDVRVTACGDVLVEDVADLAFWMMLGLLRGNAGADNYVRSGAWRQSPYPLGRAASGRRIGILGFGRIGQAVGRRGVASGMDVAYHSRRAVEGTNAVYFHAPEELAKWAELLVVAVPPEGTNRMVDRAMIDALGPGGILVNVARGSIVDEQALREALSEGRLAGAALDVFDREPDIDPRLLEVPNLLLSPHLGSATRDARHAMLEHVVANVSAFERGGQLAGVLP